MQHFSQQLVTLAASDLSAAEKNALSLIISKLFADLDLGHSCSNLQLDGAHTQTRMFHRRRSQTYRSPMCLLSSDKQIELLLKSGLAYEYLEFPSELTPLPISILSLIPAKSVMPAYTPGDEGEIPKINLIYITKYLQYELDILNKIKSICTDNSLQTLENIALLENLSSSSGIPNTEQLKAINNCLQHKFSIITGGPGTGKTTTVALLLWLLYQNYGTSLKIRICAPTGKAGKRVKDSIHTTISNPLLQQLDFSQVLALLDQQSNFVTIHKLLGYMANNIYFRYNKDNLLDLDVLIIDESSMVSLPLFSKLLQAIDENKIKHVILLGDKNQLSSVEEGYVFASLVSANNITQYVTSLVTSNRSNQDIGDLAALVQVDNIEGFKQMINNSVNIKSYKAKISDLFNKQLFAPIDNSLNEYFKYIIQSDLTDIRQLFNEFNRQIVLCLTNVGMFGTIYLNAQIEKRIKHLMANNESELFTAALDLFSSLDRAHFNINEYNQEWYTGRPIIILENDYSLELFNGDIGICIVYEGRVQVVFENERKFIPEILPKYQVAYAITIHKSQGSEYEHVNLVLCDNSGLESMSELLSKELIYTGITRAKTSISIFAGDKVLSYAIGNKTRRNTGLDFAFLH